MVWFSGRFAEYDAERADGGAQVCLNMPAAPNIVGPQMLEGGRAELATVNEAGDYRRCDPQYRQSTSRTPVTQTSASSITSPATLPEQVCSTLKCRSPAADFVRPC